MSIPFNQSDDFEVGCISCGWSGSVSTADLQDDMIGDWDGWETHCVCPECGNDLERV